MGRSAHEARVNSVGADDTDALAERSWLAMSADLYQQLPASRHGYVDCVGDIETLRLHHLDHGDSSDAGDRAPMVLIHGVCGHAGAWSAVATALASTMRPIAVDLRGHGASQWSATHDYATTTHAADVLGVLDALDLDRVSLVGSSWGALIALAVAVAQPDRVDRLVLVDIEPSFEQSETDVAPRPHAFTSAAEVFAFERGRNPNAPDRVLAAVAAASVRPGPGGLVPWFDPYFYDRWPHRRDDWWDALATVLTPTLVVHAAQSFVRREVTERMAQLLANGDHVEIGSSTHVVPVDAPAALVAVLRTFFERSP